MASLPSRDSINNRQQLLVWQWTCAKAQFNSLMYSNMFRVYSIYIRMTCGHDLGFISNRVHRFVPVLLATL